MYDIITVGSATVDAFVNTENKLFIGKKRVHVPFGSKILIKELKFDIGGGGTNSAVAFSRLGFRTGYIGKIGMGTNSQRIIALLKKENVNLSLISRENTRTGFSVILDAKGHDRTILAFKGSNDDLLYSDIIKSKLRTKWFYFSSMMGKSFETQKKLAVFAEKKGIKILFNPSSYLARKGVGYIRSILTRTNILVLNKEEAGLLINKKSISSLLHDLHKKGPEIVVITDGKHGVYAYDGKDNYFLKPHGVKVLEATGAGDSFGAGFLAGVIRKNDIEFALQLGLAEAESVITHYGTKNKLLTLNEAMRIIKRKPGKISRS
tara:strand:+ start:4562 stop:5521 length:960 start_codon:yes stop_codon:yes gene_type:complete